MSDEFEDRVFSMFEKFLRERVSVELLESTEPCSFNGSTHTITVRLMYENAQGRLVEVSSDYFTLDT